MDGKKVVLTDGGSLFVEIYVDTPLEICESRDPKGLYQKARRGEISEFTGISSPYEVPVDPEIHLKNDKMTIEENVERMLEYLAEKGYIG